jgi:glycosyltransferase involved in cell wall biosynthesis
MAKESTQLSILLLSWRDIFNPKKGGAEVVDFEILKRLAAKGYKVTWLAPLFAGCKTDETVDGIRFVRMGSFFTIHRKAIDFVKEHEADYDIIIDEYHGYPFFTNFYSNKPRVSIVHEVAGKIWFKMWKLPISVCGFMIEWACLKLLKNHKIITISDSTKSDLVKNGIKEENTFIIPEGISTIPVRNLDFEKNINQICFVGRICKMKGVSDLLKAFHFVLKQLPDIKLVLVGRIDPKFQAEFDGLIERFNLKNSVKVTGFISAEEKEQIMKESMYLASCSVKEGWGLVVTEANVLGTPAITYNVAGYRDAIKDGQTGFLSKQNNPTGIANEIVDRLTNTKDYKTIQKNAYDFSKQFNWENATDAFEKIILDLEKEKVKQPSKISKFFVKALFNTLGFAGTVFNKIFKFES